MFLICWYLVCLRTGGAS